MIGGYLDVVLRYGCIECDLKKAYFEDADEMMGCIEAFANVEQTCPRIDDYRAMGKSDGEGCCAA